MVVYAQGSHSEAQRLRDSSLWFLVGNGGMDPYDSPLKSLIVVPITHSSISYEEPERVVLSG